MTESWLQPSLKSIKKEIRNICDSYSHSWDVVAELAQNSVDAIKEWNIKYTTLNRQHSIKLEINQQNHSIVIEDTGIGISPEQMPALLAPNETLKGGFQSQLIGEKGVGITFCIFSANNFFIETKPEEGIYKGELKLCRHWKDLDDNTTKPPEPENVVVGKNKIKPTDTSTKIILSDVMLTDDTYNDIFKLSFERLVHLLRTKTAIGYTGKIFGKDNLTIDVSLKLIDSDGNIKNGKVPFEYDFPDSHLRERDVVDLDEFRAEAAEYDHTQKAQKL